MKLIVGLGNLGPHYEGTRHNAGFAVLEVLAAANNLEWVTKDKFKASVAEGLLNGEKVLLAKPTTYYNLVGESVRAIKDFYKLADDDVLIVHDELDLPFGTVRARIGGSDAGNNGIKSIIAHGSQGAARVRIGIANEHLPTTDAVDFVLNQFSHEERALWPEVQRQAMQFIQEFIDPNKKFEHTSARISA